MKTALDVGDVYWCVTPSVEPPGDEVLTNDVGQNYRGKKRRSATDHIPLIFCTLFAKFGLLPSEAEKLQYDGAKLAKCWWVIALR